MRFVRIVACAAFVFLVCAAPAEARRRVTLSDARIVAMGADTFVTYYCGRLGWSEAMEDQAAERYALARRNTGERRERALPPQVRAEVAELRANLEDISSSWFGASWGIALGGTMYSHLAARACAPREDFMGEIVGLLATDTGILDPAARRRADISLDSAARLVSALSWPEEDGDYEVFRQEFKESKRKLKASIERLALQLHRLPDAVAERVALFTLRSMPDLFEEDR